MRTSLGFKRLAAVAMILALLSTLALSTMAQAEDKGDFALQSVAEDAPVLTAREIAAQFRPSVVAIETETRVVYNNGYNNDYYNFYNPFGMFYGYPRNNQQPREYTQTGAGSGIIISHDGYILTNNHVIAGADKITVYVLPQEEGGEETAYEATLVGSSEDNDVAVLKIDAKGLTPAVFGDSDAIDFGEPAVVIGNPMGNVHGSVTTGVISAKEHEVTIDNVTINAILTDAAINSGNSGGALFDEHGAVVGIVYAKGNFQVENMGFAIPINTVRDLIESMINDPDSVYAQTRGSQIMLGITIQTVTEELSQQYSMPVGVYISEVSSMSAAERAGLQTGDIITEFAGKPVDSTDTLNAIKAEQTPGDSVPIVIDRNGNEMTLTIVIPQPTQVDISDN